MSFEEVRVLVVPTDYRRSLRFWTEGVGLEVHEAFGDGDGDGDGDGVGVLLTLGPGVRLELLAAAPAGDGAGPADVVLSVQVADAEAAHHRVHRRGVRPSELVDQPWGHRSFDVVDPDGHRLTLFEVLGG